MRLSAEITKERGAFLKMLHFQLNASWMYSDAAAFDFYQFFQWICDDECDTQDQKSQRGKFAPFGNASTDNLFSAGLKKSVYAC